MPNVKLFPGTVTAVSVPPYTSGLTFNTGDHAPWSNDTDDTSIAILEMDHNGSDFTTYTRVTANLPALTGTPTGLVAHMRARNTMVGSFTPESAHINVTLTTTSFSPFMAIGNEGSNFIHWPVTVDSLLNDYTIDLLSPNNLYTTWGTSFSAILSALNAGALHFQVQTDIHTPHAATGMQVLISALWLEAVGVGGSGSALLPAAPTFARAAPLRIHPRNDGLGTSSAPRIYPAPKSYQDSNRRAGGYL